MANESPDVRRRGRRIFAKLRRHAEEEHPETAAAAPAPVREDVGRPPGGGTAEPTEAPVAKQEADASPGTGSDDGSSPQAATAEPTADDHSREPDHQPPPGAPDAQAGAVESNHDPQELPRIVAIANQKGGVGKTTTAINLGAALAELDYRVLVVDLDPQGNATTGLGIHARDLENSIYDALMSDTPMEDCVESTSVKNLFIVPATIDLSGAEIELVPAFSRELKLRRALESVTDDYDFTLIDCPPSLGLLTINGLAAANDVIVPIQCEYYALEGLGQLLRNVSLVRGSLNPMLDVRGIILTMYDGRTRLAAQVEADVRQHFGEKVYETVIPRTIRLGEAPSFGQPIIVFDPTSRGAQTYRELAKEVSNGTSGRAG